jgi:hypothetical protein
VSLSLEVFSVLGVMMDDPDRVWDGRACTGWSSGRLGQRYPGHRHTDQPGAPTCRPSSVCDPIRTVRGVGYALVPDP